MGTPSELSSTPASMVHSKTSTCCAFAGVESVEAMKSRSFQPGSTAKFAFRVRRVVVSLSVSPAPASASSWSMPPLPERLAWRTPRMAISVAAVGMVWPKARNTVSTQLCTVVSTTFAVGVLGRTRCTSC